MENRREFDELMFFAQMKAKPGLYIGRKSLVSLRDYLFGMAHAFSFSCGKDSFRYFSAFCTWYIENVIRNRDGYCCWWNHILYTCGNHDDMAFDSFFAVFEQYLKETHGVLLPEAAWN